ncbi:hypothetical protein GHT09_015109 [Marmota monax]|uniref:Uncharacterized protein n=1 Tax=Marmota monax TaxID=9995 RepID=A0A834QC90_MARMO|nr:hypothetical protein GHT09_015109 [Marmota monax]
MCRPPLIRQKASTEAGPLGWPGRPGPGRDAAASAAASDPDRDEQAAAAGPSGQTSPRKSLPAPLTACLGLLCSAKDPAPAPEQRPWACSPT